MNTQSKPYPYIQVLRKDRDVLYDIIMYGIYLHLHNQSFIQARGHDVYAWISHDVRFGWQTGSVWNGAFFDKLKRSSQVVGTFGNSMKLLVAGPPLSNIYSWIPHSCHSSETRNSRNAGVSPPRLASCDSRSFRALPSSDPGTRKPTVLSWCLPKVPLMLLTNPKMPKKNLQESAMKPFFRILQTYLEGFWVHMFLLYCTHLGWMDRQRCLTSLFLFAKLTTQAAPGWEFHRKWFDDTSPSPQVTSLT